MNCLSIATGNGFFRLSPEDYKGLHQRYAATMQLAGESDSKPNDNEEKDEERTRLKTELASAFPLLMAWLWRQKDLKPEDLKTEQVQQFIRTHAAVLDHAVDTAIKETPLDEISVQRLKESNYVFSGIKTFHELKEAFLSLVGADGNIKPFEQFLAEVRRVHKTYNRQYLQAEYHLAQSSASMAARWKKFEKDGDRYLLQYRTIGDKRVRPTHRDLHGITLPINSKFWDEYFPPNNWNCRCSVVQVRRSKYTQSDEAEAMRLGLKATAGKYREMFLFNPGKTMTCFPMYNAYTRKTCIDCKKKPGNLELAADIPDNELCQVCQILKQMHIDRISVAEEGIRNILNQLENGYANGELVEVGRLSNDIISFVQNKGIDIKSNKLYISDKRVKHALRPAKVQENKAVTKNQLISLPSLMNDCEVYWDSNEQNIQFITRQDEDVQKFVFKLNDFVKVDGIKRMLNNFSTAGKIEGDNLNMQNYTKIR